MKTYYAFTKPKERSGYVVVDGKVVNEFTLKGDRATVAVEYDGKVFRYGISICSSNDNFCKEEGRLLADMRLLHGFGQVEETKFAKFKEMTEAGTHEAKALMFLRLLTNNVEAKMDRYKRKVREFGEKMSKLA